MIATSTPPLILAAILVGSYTAIWLLDQVAFGWLDLDSPRFEVGDAAVQLLRLSSDLEQHPALVTSHVGAADVGHQRELLAELVDHRLLHHGRAKDQLQPPPPHTRSLSGSAELAEGFNIGAQDVLVDRLRIRVREGKRVSRFRVV